MSDTAPSIREALEAASTAPDPAPVAQDPAPVEVEAPAVEAASEPKEVAEQSAGPSRDEKGRFAPKSAEKPEAPGHGASDVTGAAKVVTPAPAPAAAAVATPPVEPKIPETPPELAKAPSSWKPVAREKWASLPAEVKAEAVRIDREVRRVMQETAEVRKQYQQIQEIARPWEHLIRASGSDVPKTIETFFKSAGVLNAGPIPARVELLGQLFGTHIPTEARVPALAHLIASGGIDIQQLDQALAAAMQGRPQRLPTQAPVDPGELVRRAKDELRKELEQERGTFLQQKAEQEAEAFAKEHEFFDDVRETMADLIEVAEKRGIAMTYQQAYDRAVAMDEGLQQILKQRDAAKSAATAQAATQRAQQAASSVRSKPAAAPSAAQSPRTLREMIEAKAAELESRA